MRGSIRVEIIALGSESSSLQQFSVHLDCWRASLRIVCDRGNWGIDGADIGSLFLIDTSGAVLLSGQFWLGGHVIGGHPVNLNRVLTFTPLAGSPAPVYGYIIKEYYDRELPDPLGV